LVANNYLSLCHVHGEVGVEDVLQLRQGQATQLTAPATIRIIITTALGNQDCYYKTHFSVRESICAKEYLKNHRINSKISF
jgi:hypothetical protein